MNKRISKSQNLHDKVISEVKNYLNLEGYNIYLNPNGEKNAGIANNYPDIILTKKDTNNVSFIIEVETQDSINIDEATNQWKKYVSEINASFYLLIPETSKTQAEKICRELGINVRFGTYQVDKSGNILLINFE